MDILDGINLSTTLDELLKQLPPVLGAIVGGYIAMRKHLVAKDKRRARRDAHQDKRLGKLEDEARRANPAFQPVGDVDENELDEPEEDSLKGLVAGVLNRGNDETK